ncbi:MULTISPECIES: zinc-binding dehydrogenase [unclassified Amycolatopsis]|uniref:quinone oxidoreductase family protein n=1 Tax=unclassified Amycolatopsis TaxID=2618356 RepID=UPI0028750E35|nr:MULTISPECIES: zinc-binding dehydrogenase [unclassified Amycolatopsis]MDS0134136.1 zinc-binding dehydrogenase [Amycolatopsis sp. 505]MDS0145012.1 zinc-binding dehydrogenase [Amycolatopsis sp. CM201R]
MRAVVQYGTGGPEVLKVDERPVPTRKPGEVLMKTEAIGVPFYETQLRSGLLPAGDEPAIFGHEAAGIVVEADDETLRGRRVVTVSFTGGAYAEVVAASQYTLVPDELTPEQAVAAAVPASVALALIKTADLQAGETVLVEAASGAIGGYLARLAAERGARVVTTAGEGKADIDHDDPEWRQQVPDGVDVVFESIGGPRAAELLAKLAPHGRILAYGLLSGEFPTFPVAGLIARGLTLIGFGGPDAYGKRVAAVRAEALGLVADGTLTPVIDRTYPLADVAAAHARVESREGVGKVVLIP